MYPVVYVFTALIAIGFFHELLSNNDNLIKDKWFPEEYPLWYIILISATFWPIILALFLGIYLFHQCNPK